MIRDTLAPRPLRIGVVLVGVAGTLALAGCSTAATGATDAASTGASSSGSPSGASTGAATYKDGTYTASGSYQTPETVEKIEVTITLADDVVTAVEVKGDPQASETERYQSEFIGGINGEVVGKNIDELSVDRVAGSSLTSGGFNKALDEIKVEAAG